MLLTASICYFVFNVITFIVYGIDKHRATKHKYRIPERTLLWLAVLGGSIGALSAMKVFRHKTQHLKFQIGIPAIIILQLLLLFLLLYLYMDK